MKLQRNLSSEDSRQFWASLERNIAIAKQRMPSWLTRELEDWQSRGDDDAGATVSTKPISNILEVRSPTDKKNSKARK